MEDESLICEALVREIGRATRWTAIVEAWEALMYVRLMAAAMASERDHLATGSVSPTPTPDPMTGPSVLMKDPKAS